MSMWWTCRHLVDADGCKKKKIFNLLQHVMGMRWMGCMDVLRMGVDTDACKEKRKKEKSYCWVSIVFKSPVLGPQKDRRPNWTGPKKDRTVVAVQALWWSVRLWLPGFWKIWKTGPRPVRGIIWWAILAQTHIPINLRKNRGQKSMIFH